MQSFIKGICCFALVIFISAITFAGVIKGRITDAQTGEPLAGATVEIVQNKTKMHAIVNLDGSYVIRNVAVGEYQLSVKSVGYSGIGNQAIAIKEENGTVVFSTTLHSEAAMLNEVTIVTGNKESDRGARSLEKASPVLVNMLSQKTIELLPDLTVANALQRISGVSIQRSSSGKAL